MPGGSENHSPQPGHRRSVQPSRTHRSGPTQPPGGYLLGLAALACSMFPYHLHGRRIARIARMGFLSVHPFTFSVHFVNCVNSAPP